MATNTSIEWTRSDDGTAGRTWNPTTGCDRVSAGCDHCYAMTMAKRLKGMGSAKYQKDGDPRTSGPGFGLTVHEDTLRDPLGWRKPSKVFVNSMSDLFHAEVPDEFLAKVFAVMAATPQHTYQILTKRHGRMRSLLSSDAHAERVAAECARLWQVDQVAPFRGPLPNVWLGVSVEDQERANLRIPALLETPAAVRFISAEPLLGPVNLWRWMDPSDPDTDCDVCGDERFADEIGVGHERLVYDDEGKDVIREEWCTGPSKGTLSRRINWVIVGGESGGGARAMEEKWARDIVTACRDAGVAPFMKQMGSIWARDLFTGGKSVASHGDPKGGDPQYWPADLRVREYPQQSVGVA